MNNIVTFMVQFMVILSFACESKFDTDLDGTEGVIAETGITAATTATVTALEFDKLTAFATSSSEIRVNWTLSNTNTANVRISFQAGVVAPESCASGKLVSAEALTASAYTIAGLEALTTYSIRACIAELGPTEILSPGRSVTATTGSVAPPLDPVNVVATADSPYQITLSWAPAGGVAFGYIIAYQPGLMSPTSCHIGTTIAASAISGASHSIANLEPGSPYSYRVCAIDSGMTPLTSFGVTGAIFSLASPLGALIARPPTGIFVSSAGNDPMVTVLWSPSANAKSYQLKACTNSDCTQGCTNSQTSLGTWLKLNAPLAQGTYFMCVSAANAGGIASSFAASPAFLLDLVPPAPTFNMPPATADYGSFLSVNCIESGLILRVSSTKLTPNPTVATCISASPLAISLNWLGSGATTLSVTATDEFPNTSAATTHALTVALSPLPTVTIVRKTGQSDRVFAGESVQFTATFAGPVVGFESSDILQIGTLQNLVWSLSTTDQTTFTLQTTVPVGVLSGSIRPSLPQNSAHNPAGQNVTTHSSDTIYVGLVTLGLLDNEFNTVTLPVKVDASYDNSIARASARDSAGNLYVIGDINKSKALALWKYDSDGAAVTAFGSDGVKVFQGGGFDAFSGNALVFDQANNQVYVAATFDDMAMGILGFNATTGALNPNFGEHAGYSTYSSRVSSGKGIALHDSAIYVVGSRENADGNFKATVWKYSLTGEPDSSFGDGTTSESGGGLLCFDSDSWDDAVANTVAVDNSGNVILSGELIDYRAPLPLWITTTAGGTYKFTALGDNGGINAITVVAADTYLIAGHSYHADTGDKNATVWKVARVDEGGEFFEDFDGTFGSFGRQILSRNSTLVNAIAVDSDGSIFAAGLENGAGNAMMWKLTASGELAANFATDGTLAAEGIGNGAIHGIAIVGTGVFALGQFRASQAMWHYNTSDGTSLQGFPYGGYSTPDSDEGSTGYATAVDANGDIYVTGYEFDPDAGEDIAVIWKYSASGEAVATFGDNGIVRLANGRGGYVITFDASSSVYVAGLSTQSNLAIWKMSSGGVMDVDFPNGQSLSASPTNVLAIAVDSSANIYVAGSLAMDGIGAVWKVDANNGDIVADFAGGGVFLQNCVYGSLNSMVIDGGGKINVGGECYDGSESTNNVWTLHASTGNVENTTLIPISNGSIRKMTLGSDDSIFVAGLDYNTSAPIIAKMLSNKSLDMDFGSAGMVTYNPDDGVSRDAIDLVLGADGALYLAGNSDMGKNFIWKMGVDGEWDATFGIEGEFSGAGEVLDMASDEDTGRLVLVGLSRGPKGKMLLTKVK